MNDNTTSREIVECLKDLGITNPESRIIAVLRLAPVEGFSQKDIAIAGYLNQPEVSVGLRSLRERGWVTVNNVEKVSGKGRPCGIFSLMKTMTGIIDEIEEGVTGEYELVIADIERLRKII